MTTPSSRERFNAFKRGDITTVGITLDSRDYNNNNLAKANDNSSYQGRVKLDYNNYKQLKERIYRQREYLLAQTWGLYPKYLCQLCVEYGESRVVGMIRRVENIRNEFFSHAAPITRQRGAYLRRLILTSKD